MNYAALALACLIASSALADETIDVPCMPLSALKDRASYRVMTHDEWIVARVVFFNAPDTPTKMPPGDKALLRINEDGSASFVFVDGDEICAPGVISKLGAELFRLVKDGVITHPPGKL